MPIKKDYKPDPVFNGLPDTLKNPRCFKRVLAKVLKAGESGHKHKYAVTWTKCKVCQSAFLNKRKVLKEFGFTDYQQFIKWRKVMSIIHYYKKHGTKVKTN